jgi:Cof subfamily protein (haloacid dehalogenase superfamily)
MDRIALVISDVDGTLVDTQKRVTERTRQAVGALHARGIGFTVVSSRPPFGLRMLVEALGITEPLAAFNGGAIVSPALKILNQRSIDRDIAREIIAFLDEQKIGAWLFTGEEWLTRDPAGADVERETHTVQQPPRIVENFDAVIDRAGKIVGVSDDFARLEAIERQAQSQFAGRAMAVRSQSYYLDFVALGVDKGVAVRELSKTIGVPFSQIVTLGDMENDVPMFRQAGFSIAMGNASDAVKRQAREATLANDEDGFAAAVERLILPRTAADR